MDFFSVNMTGVFISVRRRLRSSSGRLLCICRECECDKGRGDIYEVHYCHDYYSGASAVHWQGLAIAMATYIIYNYRDRSDGFVFAFGTFIGVAYEYICSVFTEIVFGKIFWDYRGLPFNLGGRINLLYCFFWGIAAVVRLKKLYPLFSNLIERIPMRTGKIVTWCLVAFMCVDISVSTLALARCNGRSHHRKAANGIERLLDERFPVNRMKQIYPNGKTAGN